jgi:hypothetical protein
MDNFDLKKYLAEGRLFEEDFKNPILDKYLELKKSVDNNTAFEYELSDFINGLDNTEREGLESDLGLERDELYEGRLLKEEIMVDTTIMFGGNDYIKDVLTSPDDFGFDEEDAEWIKSNILTAPKMVSIEDYMALEDKWVEQADLDVGTGADRESVLDAIDVHIKQGLITPEEGEEAKKIALKF